jgi:DNA repair ATPase RecN
MRKPLYIALAVVVLLPLCGCGSRADSALAAYLADLNKLADAIEADDAQLAKDIFERVTKTEQELMKIKVTKSELERLKKKYKERIDKATARVKDAIEKKGIQGRTPNQPIF